MDDRETPGLGGHSCLQARRERHATRPYSRQIPQQAEVARSLLRIQQDMPVDDRCRIDAAADAASRRKLAVAPAVDGSAINVVKEPVLGHSSLHSANTAHLAGA